MSNDYDIAPKINDIFAKKINPILENDHKKVTSAFKRKEERIRDYRREASRMASMANKRLQRLEGGGLTDSPAYKGWLDSGGQRFGIRGKTYNEVQSEVARLNRFLGSETSTIRGANRVLRQIADNTGIKYNTLQDLRSSSRAFFEIASKVEQYLRTVEDMASAIGYQKIWEQINAYVQDKRIDLRNADDNIDQMVLDISRALKEWETPVSVNVSGWYKLPKN